MMRTQSRPVATVLAALLLLPALLLGPAPRRAEAAEGDGTLLLETYATAPAEVVLGKEFELKLALRNAGSKKATDILVTVGSATASGAPGASDGAAASAGSLVVVGTGNTKRVVKVAGKAREVVSFRMQSDPSGSPGLVTVPVQVEYTCNGRRSMSQQIGLVLRRQTRLKVVSLETPSDAVAGTAFTVTAEITNAGDAKVNGVSLRLSAPGAEIENGDSFLGNLEPGDGDSLEANVTLPSAGETDLTLTVSYLDEFGETRETTQVVKVEAAAAERSAETTETKTDSGFFGAIAGFFRALFGLGD